MLVSTISELAFFSVYDWAIQLDNMSSKKGQEIAPIGTDQLAQVTTAPVFWSVNIHFLSDKNLGKSSTS